MKCLLPPLLLAQGHAVHGELSIYNSSTSRADAIASSRVLIKNERRNITIGTTTYQYYDGPVAQNASLTELLRFSEINPILNNRTTYAWYMAAIIQSETAVGHLNSMEGIAKIYDLASDQLPKPMATDISDVTFGRERLTTKAMKLRQVRLNEYSNTTFQLSDAKLSDICGKDVVWKNIRDKNALYVEDYHDIAEWNDKSAPEKYVPNVVGFFCYNDKSAELLPVEIHYPDTKLSYTPFDAKEEWTLAKMGLNAASVSHHQWQHMAETHATMVPIRVELIRNMAFEHPVRSLIEHHARNDLGLESLMPEFLFNVAR
ncbi:hypothetical protein Poli38472_014949 [Pythium oligandrum]|uniref:Lipoxygenase domain-containing protein n=1 Tax=Pythium oligandrum TaxID=41045 RepID=A0A8K1C741_PYTOL|nr:hypothetical protein Poli38472_014949 [Pythium oligandrum]|eukprot:TMW57641.1 hypothetical protein Poli38472_014949 [Pythium oligandrum]